MQSHITVNLRWPIWCFHVGAPDLRRPLSWSGCQGEGIHHIYVFTLQTELGSLWGQSEMTHNDTPPPCHQNNRWFTWLTWGDSRWKGFFFFHALSPISSSIKSKRGRSHSGLWQSHSPRRNAASKTNPKPLAGQDAFIQTAIVCQP